MYQTIADLHAIAHEQMDAELNPLKGDGGKIRGKRGKIVETIVSSLWCSKGDDATSSHGKYRVSNRAGTHEIEMHLDCSLFRGDTLVGMVECKAYLDLCYLERADWNASHLKRANIACPMAVVALEQALADESASFVLGDGNIDSIFYLCDGRRSAARPMYKAQWFKPISEDRFSSLNSWMDKIYAQAR